MNFVKKFQGISASMAAVEWQAMAWLTRMVMLAAIAANWKKATDTLQVMSKQGGGVWDPFALAFALEGAFAISAYFLSMQVQRKGEGGRLRVLALAISVPALGILSGVANVDYFLRYSAVEGAWALWRAILMGSAAPIIAVLTAILAGTVSAIALDVAEAERDAEAEARQHELALAKQATAQARAAARRARAEIAGTVPEGRRKDNGNRRWTPEKLLKEYPEAAGWSGRRIGSMVGLSERQGRNWRKRMAEMEPGDASDNG